MNDSYFFIHWEKFNKGEIINSGSMGEYLFNYSLNPSIDESEMIWRLFQEQYFEYIRKINFPEKPCRYNSNFLFSSLNEAINYIQKDQRDGENIFRIKLTLPNAKIHKGSINLCRRVPMGRPILQAMQDIAIQYWNSIDNFDSESDFEIVVESPIEIIEIIK